MSTAIIIFLAFTGFTLGLSFWLGRRAKSSAGYFAAHGQVGWFVNGIAFAGDYLSAASFLGICGMIAFFGYDGFLYSIGFLAGWVVALFVIAEPIKKLGKYTFADALNARFGSRGITLAAGISTLVVSVFYLIPQMVGAGALIKPLLGLDHHWGVIIVGAVVIMIVVTAGMVSTTWVQFIKGSLLVVFCMVLVGMILNRGIRPTSLAADDTSTTLLSERGTAITRSVAPPAAMTVATPGDANSPAGPVSFIGQFSGTQLVRWQTAPTGGWTGSAVAGSDMLLPGGSSLFKGVRSEKLSDRLDFVSLMLALFCGTAALPHILIRYYTVKDAAAARKSTVVGIAAIGLFYVLTLYIGLGAMVSGMMPSDPKDSNMVAPLLARSFNELMFAVITAIAFTTVLGTVSGLILAASGAVAHDLIEHVLGHKLRDDAKVGAAKWAAVVVGVIAIGLGIVFKPFNVTFLVGWAFNIAASANLPAIVMILFWARTTRQGVIASIVVGLVSSLGWLLLSGPAYKDLWGIDPARAIAPFSQPGLVTIPLAFAVLVIVSLMTDGRQRRDIDVQPRA
jgi:cation/acetate symporter